MMDFGGVVGAHLSVDPALDLGQFVAADRLEMREVEAQAFRRNQRTLLHDMFAKDAAQGSVQQVGGRMVEHGGAATLAIDRTEHAVATLEAAGDELADMAVELAGELQRVVDDEPGA